MKFLLFGVFLEYSLAMSIRSLCTYVNLKQIYKDQDWDFFVKNSVKVGAARRFVSDISKWAKQL
jgi:hypothetical protein